MNRIGKYEIEAEIGRGGFGKVYRGFDPQVRRLVAIKILNDYTDLNAVGRFRIEATAAGNLLHKNIVTIYEFGQDAGLQFLVMEYLDGEDLQKVISSRRALSLLTKIRIMHEVGDALHCAHRHGVVHRDVKPANIMLLSTGNVKIMDFGIARLTSEDAMRLTIDGFIMGSVPYMAPEQFQNGKVDELSDIWAYGCVFYELLAGGHPFQGRDTPSLLYKITSYDPPPISTFVGACPHEIDSILLKLLSRDREARYQTFEDVQLDLDFVLLSLQEQEAAKLFLEARKRRDANEFEKADALIGQVLDFDRGNVEGRRFREELRASIRTLRAVRPKIEAFLTKAEEAFKRTDYAMARDLAQSALQLDPTNEQARKRLMEALEAHERSQRAAQLLTEAEQYLQKSELTAAYAKAMEAQETEPANSRAMGLLAGIQHEMEVREGLRKIRDALSKAKGLVVAGSLVEAVQLLTELRSMYPESAEVSALLDRTVNEKSAQENRQRLAVRITDIRELLRADRLAAAVAELEELQRAFPDESEVQTMLSYAQETFYEQRRKDAAEKIGREAWALCCKKKFDQALSMLNLALQEYPADERLARLMQQVRSAKAKDDEEREIAEGCVRFENLCESGKLADAEQILGALASKYPRSEKWPAARAQLRKNIDEAEGRKRQEWLNRQLARAREILKAGQADQAIQLLEEIGANANHPEIAATLNAARKAQGEQQVRLEIEAVLKDVNALEAAGNLADARQLLDPALQRHPGSADLGGAARHLDAVLAEDHRRKALAAIAQSVEDELRSENWQLCLSRLADADQRYPGDISLRDLRSQVNRTQREALEGFLEEIKAGMDRRDWPFCAKHLADAERLFPGDLGVQAHRVKIQAEQQKEELERRRQDTLARLEETVEAAILRQDFPFSRAQLDEADNDFPGDPILRKLRAKVASAQRECEEIHNRAVAGASTAVLNGIRRQDWRFCDERLTQVEQRFPDDASLRDLRSLLERTRQTEDDRQRRDALYAIVRAVEEGMERRDWMAGLDKLNEADQQFPGEPEIRSLRERLMWEQLKEEKSRHLQTLGEMTSAIEEAFARRDWGTCQTRLQEAEKHFPGDPLVQALLEKLNRAQLQEQEDLKLRAIADIEAAIEQGVKQRDWPVCDKHLSEAEQRYPSEPALRTLRAKVGLERHRDEDERRLQSLAKISKAVDAEIANRDWAKCEAQLNEALERYPAEPMLRSLRTRVALERQRVEEEQKRAALSAIVKTIEASIKGHDWQSCWEQLAESEKSSPGDPLLRNLHTRVEVEQQRDQEELRRSEMNSALRAIEDSIRLRDWQLSLSRLRDAEGRFPGEGTLRELRARVEQEKDRDEASRRREVEDLRVRISDAIVREEWVRGNELIQFGLQQNPNDSVLLQFCAQMKAGRERRKSISEAEALRSKQKLVEAEGIIRTLLRIHSDDPEAKAILESIEAIRRDKYRQARAEAERLTQERQFDAALRKLEALLKEYPGNVALMEDANGVRELKRRKERKEAYLKGREQSDHLLADRKFDAAIHQLQEVLRQFPGDTALLEAVQTAQAAKRAFEQREAVTAAREQAARLIRDRKFDESIQTLGKLLAEFPNDPALEEELKTACEARTIHLQRLEVNERVAELEKLYRKGDFQAVKGQAPALLTKFEDPRARELLEWARSAARGPTRPFRAAKLFVPIAAGLLIAIGAWLWLQKPVPPPKAAEFRVTPEELDFKYQGGTAPKPQAIVIQSVGRRLKWTLSASGNWLSVSSKSGETPATVNVLGNASALKPGTYNGFLTVSSPGEATPPKNVQVNVTVVEPPVPQNADRQQLPSPATRVFDKPRVIEKTPTPPAHAILTPDPAPIIAPGPPPAVNCHAADYSGLSKGTITWTGELALNATLTFGRSRGPGIKGDPLPGCDVGISITAPPGVVEEERPNAANHFSAVKLRNNSNEVLFSVVKVSWAVK